MTWWVWVLFGFFLLALEFISTTMHVGFFGAGALFVACLVGLGWHGPLWAQLLVFTAFSLVALFIIRPPLMRKLKLTQTKIVDTMVGERATAMDDIAVQSIGKAEMRGSSWSARNVGTTPIPKGQGCVVDGIEGLVLQVRAK